MVSRRECCFAIAAAAGVLAVPSAAVNGLRGERVEARYWRRDGTVVQCELCPHGCRLGDGKTGICRNRKNIGGVLYALGYGKPCAVHIDPIEKKPFYHVLPGSRTVSLGVAGCNLRCKNCQNYTISQRGPLEIPSTDLSPAAATDLAVRKNCPIVAFTYTEPSVWIEYVMDTADAARNAGLKTAFISSGYLNPVPFSDCAKVLDFARFDLKSFSERTYRELNAGKLQPVLDTILLAKKEGLWVEIINLVIPGWNDSDKEVRALCRWVKQYVGGDTPVHFSRFFPLYKLSHAVPTPLTTLRKAVQIARSEGLVFPYIGNVPGEGTATMCPRCHKTLIERNGYVIVKNNCVEGRCVYCGYSIAGVWGE